MVENHRLVDRITALEECLKFLLPEIQKEHLLDLHEYAFAVLTDKYIKRLTEEDRKALGV